MCIEPGQLPIRCLGPSDKIRELNCLLHTIHTKMLDLVHTYYQSIRHCKIDIRQCINPYVPYERIYTYYVDCTTKRQKTKTKVQYGNAGITNNTDCKTKVLSLIAETVYDIVTDYLSGIQAWYKNSLSPKKLIKTYKPVSHFALLFDSIWYAIVEATSVFDAYEKTSAWLGFSGRIGFAMRLHMSFIDEFRMLYLDYIVNDIGRLGLVPVIVVYEDTDKKIEYEVSALCCDKHWYTNFLA